jgi:hypothetical protein
MPTECTFTLPTGRKCRCMATRGFAFCRHHGAPGRPRVPRHEREWSRLSCWRNLSRAYQEEPVEELPARMLFLLQSLLQDEVSDRFAGRSLRILLKRFNGIPFIVAPEFDQPPAIFSPAPPAPPAQPAALRAESPEDAAERMRMIRWAQSLAASFGGPRSVPGSQPPVAQSRPSAPSRMAVR